MTPFQFALLNRCCQPSPGLARVGRGISLEAGLSCPLAPSTELHSIGKSHQGGLGPRLSQSPTQSVLCGADLLTSTTLCFGDEPNLHHIRPVDSWLWKLTRKVPGICQPTHPGPASAGRKWSLAGLKSKSYFRCPWHRHPSTAEVRILYFTIPPASATLALKGLWPDPVLRTSRGLGWQLGAAQTRQGCQLCRESWRRRGTPLDSSVPLRASVDA